MKKEAKIVTYGTEQHMTFVKDNRYKTGIVLSPMDILRKHGINK